MKAKATALGILLALMLACTPVLWAQSFNANIAGIPFVSGPSVPSSCAVDGGWFFKNAAPKSWSQCISGVYVSSSNSSLSESPTNKNFTSASGGNTLSLLNRQDAIAPITGTAAVTQLYLYNIPQNVLAAGRCVRVEAWWTHTTGSASVTYNWSFVAHGAGLANSGQAITSATTTLMSDEIVICNNNAVQNAQIIYQKVAWSASSAVANSTGSPATAIDTAASGGVDIALTFNVANTDAVTPKNFIVTLIQ